MSTTVPNLPIKQAPRWSRHFPWLVIGFVAIALSLLWSIPPDMFERGMRVMITYALTALALVLLNGWWLVGASVGSSTRLGVEAGAIVALFAFVACITSVEFTGDMQPIFHFRWNQSQDEILEANRRQQQLTSLWKVGLAPSGAKFAEYRGVARDGVVVGPALSRDWQSDPPQLVWRQPVGGGFAAFAVADGKAVTIEQRRQREAVVAYDATTGRELWVYDYPALFSEKLGGDGPRATPTIADSQVYSLGATGVLCCLDLATGQLHWSVNILEQNHVPNLDWGMSGSPLIDGELVILNPGAQEGGDNSCGLMGLKCADGAIAWRAGKSRASYSSPMLATVDGIEQIVVFDAGGVAGYDRTSGKELWRFAWQTQFDINVAQPLVIDGSKILITSSTGCALLHVMHEGDTWTAKELWRNRNLKCAFTNPIYHDGYVYGLDEGILVCLKAADGTRAWKKGRYGHGQMLLTGNLLLILGEQGELVLVEANPNEFRELGRLQALEGKTWNCPALADGRAYVRNHQEMACYDLRPAAERGNASAAATLATDNVAAENEQDAPAAKEEKAEKEAVAK